MAVDPILRLTNEIILNLLDKVSFVVHTIVPETYKFWKSNLPDAYPHPTGICLGPPGFLFALDVSDSGSCGKLMEIRLHYPADIKVKKINEGLSGSLCYLEGVTYICTKSGEILYADIQNKVKVQVNKIKTKRELEGMLQSRNLQSSGTISELRIRLEKHLKHVAKQHTSNDHILLDEHISPSVICCGSESKTLYCFDEKKSLSKLNLCFDGVGIKGDVIRLCTLSGVEGVRGMHVLESKQSLLCTVYGSKTGIMLVSIATGDQKMLVEQDGLAGICVLGEPARIMVCDSLKHTVSVVNSEENVLIPLIGSGEAGFKDGTASTSKFSEPYGICSEGRSLFISDPCCGRVALVSD